jgi:hypothetical protein
MTPFEYQAVLISIVLGLGITHVLSSVHKLVQARQQVRLYWLPLAWTALLFVAQVEWWWANFQLLSNSDYSFFYFLFILLSPVALYLAAAFVLPDIEPGVHYDLRTYYYGVRGWFFGALAFQLLCDGVRRAVQSGSVASFGVASNAIAAILFGLLAVTARSWYHTAITVAVTVLFLSFVAVDVSNL